MACAACCSVDTLARVPWLDASLGVLDGGATLLPEENDSGVRGSPVVLRARIIFAMSALLSAAALARLSFAAFAFAHVYLLMW